MTSSIPAAKVSGPAVVMPPKVGLAGCFIGMARWRGRFRQRRELCNLDARMLDDIGMTRAQALAEAQKPWWRA